MPTSILIADDHGVLRAGLRSLLNAENDMEVVGEAADGHAAIAEALRLLPKVVLADISMPGPSGIEVTQELKRRSPEIRVLILTMHEDHSLVDEAMHAGACGYVIKRAAESELIGAIRTVADGGIYVAPEMLRQRRHEAFAAPPAPQVPDGVLTPFESDLLRLLALGYTNQQAASRLALSVSEVEAARAGFASRFGLRSRIDLLKYAREHDLVEN